MQRRDLLCTLAVTGVFVAISIPVDLFLETVEDARPVLVSAHAYEREGVNTIPAALARLLSERLMVPFDPAVVQTNGVGHTGASGYGRPAQQAAFGGEPQGAVNT